MTLNTDSIEEAKIVPEPTEPINTTSSDEDLLKKLSEITETKTPGTAQQTNKVKKTFWESTDEDFEETVKSAASEQTKKETAPENKEQPAEKTPGKPTEKMKLGSAKTAVGMLEFTNKLLFPPILNYRLKKKVQKSFKEQDIALLDEKLIDAEKSELDAKEMALRNRWDRMMNKHAKKVGAIPFSTDEKEDLIDAFKNYFDYTESTLSPGWYLGLAVINSMGRRAIDTFVDE